MNLDRLKTKLDAAEARRVRVYDDRTGKDIVPGTLVQGHPTIGVGRALDVNGLSGDEIEFLLDNDIRRRQAEILRALPWWSTLDDVRQEVVFEMEFQTGLGGLLGFHDALSHMKAGRFEDAAREMLDSHVARDVAPGRWRRMAEEMRTGVSA